VTPINGTPDGRVRPAEGNHALEKAEKFVVLPASVPVEPARQVILVIGIIVAAQRMQKFVPGGDHRRALGEQEQGAKVPRLFLAQREDLGGRAFLALVAAVPAQVIIAAVGILISVGFVVLLVVGDKIVQAEPVVGGDEIDALVRAIGLVEFVGEEIVAAVKALHRRAHLAGVALDERADVVAELPVPLRPVQAGKGAAELIAADVPRFGEKIEARSKRKPSTPILRDQKRRLSSTSARPAGWPVRRVLPQPVSLR